MQSRKAHVLLGLAVAGLLTVSGGATAAEPAKRMDGRTTNGFGLGQQISERDLVSWDIDVRTTDGVGLPAGSGSVSLGKEVYDGKCLSCHGDKAAGGSMFGSMVGGIGSFTTDKRVLTPGSMYPYAPALFDYIRRAMPLTQPQSLSNEEVYAVTGYLLQLNGLLPGDAVVDAKTLTELKMPNRDGFIRDDRPDTQAVRCMESCSALR